MKIIQQIQNNLFIGDLVSHYGHKINNKGFINCQESERTPSCKIYLSRNRFKCFSCNKSGDVIDFIIHEENCSFKEALNKAASLANLNNLTPEQIKENAKRKLNIDKNSKLDYNIINNNKQKLHLKLQKLHENLYKTDYFTNRGLSTEIQNKCKLGFNQSMNSVIIPYSNKLDYFMARSILGKDFYKPSIEELGFEPVWNEKILSVSGVTVYVCEGAIDAMSLMEIGLYACAVGGVNCEEKMKRVNIKANLIWAFDNDENPKTKQKTISVVNHLIDLFGGKMLLPSKYKDWNDWLVSDRASLINYLK